MNTGLDPPAADAAGACTDRDAPPRGGADLYEKWLSSQQGGERPLTPAGAASYKAIWTAWLKYLAGAIPRTAEEQRWALATPEHVARYLGERIEGNRTTLRAPRAPSAITRRGYWRLLRRIYAYACAEKWLAKNPVEDIAIADRPSAREPVGVILDARLWKNLPRHFPPADSPVQTRDRAVLMVLYHLGLASSEIRALQLEDVLFVRRQHTPEGAEHTAVALLRVRCKGRGRKDWRDLVVPPEVGSAIELWLDARKVYAPVKSKPSKLLFTSRQGGPLTMRGLFRQVALAIRGAAEAQAARDGLAVAAYPERWGPQVLRNTWIVNELNAGKDEDGVLERAGLKDARGLAHLRVHLHGSAADGPRWVANGGEPLAPHQALGVR